MQLSNNIQNVYYATNNLKKAKAIRAKAIDLVRRYFPSIGSEELNKFQITKTDVRINL